MDAINSMKQYDLIVRGGGLVKQTPALQSVSTFFIYLFLI